MKKRLLSGVTAALLALSTIPMSAFTASAAATPDFVLTVGSDVTVKPGDTFTLTTKIDTNVEGFSVFNFKLKWKATDMKMTARKVKKSTDPDVVIPPLYSTQVPSKLTVDEDGYYSIVIGGGSPVGYTVEDDETGEEKIMPYTFVGDWLDLTFEVSADATGGDIEFINDETKNQCLDLKEGDSQPSSLSMKVNMPTITIDAPVPHVHDFKLVAEQTDPTCTTPGSKAYYYCSGCEKYSLDATGAVAFTADDLDEKIYIAPDDSAHKFPLKHHEAVADECQKDGSIEYWECELCGKYFSDSDGTEEITDKTSVVIGQTGHTWGETTYDWVQDTATGDWTACTAKRVCTRNTSHVETATGTVNKSGTEPNCTTHGSLTYTATFDKEWAGTDSKHEEPDPNNDHDLKHHEAKAVDCKEDGNIEYWECQRCGKFFSDAEGKTEITDKTSVVIGQTGHTWGEITYTWKKTDSGWSCTAERVCTNNSNHVDREEASISVNTGDADCTTPGTTTYTPSFKNPDFSTAPKVVTGEALGHKWGEASYKWEDGKCTATRICDRCKQTETSEAEVTEIVVQPTCTEPGTIAYKAEFPAKDSEWTETQTTDPVKNAEPKGHDFGAPAYEWKEENGVWKCTATRVCSRDASHVETETVTGVKDTEKSVEVKCMTDGKDVFTATFENTAFNNAPVKEVVLTHPGHSWGGTGYTWAADHSTCTAKRICTVCSEPETSEVTSTPSSTPATCDEAEQITYTAAFTVDWAETQTEGPIEGQPKLGHDYGTPTYEWKEENGVWKCTATRVCSRDASHVETETVTGVKDNEKSVEVKCMTDGKDVFTATFENTAFNNAPDKEVTLTHPGHTFDGTVSYEWATDNSTCTAKRICTVCSEPETSNGTVEPVTVPADCDNDGYSYYKATFTDDWAKEQKTEPVKTDDKLGHNWGVPTYTWDGKTKTFTAQRVCSRDASHIDSETVNATVDEENSVAPTCTAGGKTVYVGTFENAAFEQQKQTVDEDALGHDWGETTYEWTQDSDGDYWCTATRKCKVSTCGFEQSETVGGMVSVRGDDTVYTADFEEPDFETQYKTVYGEVSYEAGSVSWKKGSTNGAEIVVKRNINDNVTFDEFKSVAIDGETVDAANYTTEKGSLKLVLKAAYLETLADGEHNVTIAFAKGNAVAKLTVEKADEKPDDGKPDDGKTDDGKTDDGKTDDGKTDDGKTDDGKTPPNTGAAAGAASAIAVVVIAAAVVLKKKKD